MVWGPDIGVRDYQEAVVPTWSEVPFASELVLPMLRLFVTV
jgi:hypothetical protein